MRALRYFFSSQDFSAGLRTTLAVLLPGLWLGAVGELEAGLTASLGALCLSITDQPGPVRHRRNGMAAALALLPLVALLTGTVQPHLALLGLEVAVLSFGCTLLLAYGARAGTVGTAGLLLMILMTDRPLAGPQLLRYAALVSAGGAWYVAVSLLTYQLRPYRPAQQALGECIRAVADFLRLKAEFYRPGTRLDDGYRRLVAQQVVVSEKQEAARELLFKTRQLVQESTGAGRRLVLAFVDAVDLYEHVTATYYDYAALHARFGATGVLDAIADLAEQLADELADLGLAVQANHGYRRRTDFGSQLERLKARIDALPTATDPAHPGSPRVLLRLLVNLRTLSQRVHGMAAYFDGGAAPWAAGRELEFGRFVSRQPFEWKELRAHLTLESGVFRHAVRVALANVAAFVVAKLVLPSHHSYWILMTTTYMLKPAYSLTKERNVQRVLGTLLGGVAGGVLLWLVPGHPARLVLLAGCMLATFSFSRRYYLAAVACMTPMVLILFSFLGLPFWQVVEERVLDTVLGCLIAAAASYLLFPRWESEQLHDHLAAVLQANLRYLHTLAELLAGRPVAVLDYKLARKEVYVSSANLAAAFQRMLSEPRAKQHRPTEVHQFVVLNHVLSSNVAALASTRLAAPDGASAPPVPPAALRPVRQAQQALRRALQRLAPTAPPAPLPELPAAPEAAPAPPDAHLAEQLEFVLRVGADIDKVTEEVLG